MSKDNTVEFPTPDSQPVDPFADPYASSPSLAPRVLPRDVAAGQANKQHGVGDNQLLIDNANARIVLEDETKTPRMIIGLLPDNTIGIVISKVGVNVFNVFST